MGGEVRVIPGGRQLVNLQCCSSIGLCRQNKICDFNGERMHFDEASLQRLRRHGNDVSGFHLLERNEDALRWRLALIDSARHSLDLHYCVWFGDSVGVLLLQRAKISNWRRS